MNSDFYPQTRTKGTHKDKDLLWIKIIILHSAANHSIQATYKVRIDIICIFTF